jgi:hypothetical protein
VSELLPYRGHQATDVPPVLITRDGAMLIIAVRYPPAARSRARNAFAFTLCGTFSYVLCGLYVAHYWPRSPAAILPSLWFLGLIATIVLAGAWMRSNWTYIFETDGRELLLETRGMLWSRRVRYAREWITAIQAKMNRRGNATAMEIKTISRVLNRSFFAFLDEQHIQEVIAALREGLKLEPVNAK